MKVKDSFKIALKKAFINTTFMSRESKHIVETCGKCIKGSETMNFLPPLGDNIKVDTIDETHDKWTLEFEDASFQYVVTWKPSEIRGDMGCVVFCNIEHFT